jgi:hypothetical protein
VAKYKHPYVEVGMGVLWYQGGNKSDQPFFALVSQVDPRSLCLNILAPSIHNFMSRDGVRHCDDPELREAEKMEAGTWDYAPLTRKLVEFLDLKWPPEKTDKKPEPSLTK